MDVGLNVSQSHCHGFLPIILGAQLWDSFITVWFSTLVSVFVLPIDVATKTEAELKYILQQIEIWIHIIIETRNN